MAAMKIDRNLLRNGAASGARKGFRSFIWVLKLLLPISFLTAFLEWTGWLYQIEFLFRPVMGLIHLPALAALPLLIAVIAGFWGGIAAMTALPFTLDQMTLISIFILICHSLIQEGFIQGKSGLSPWTAALSRLCAAGITTLVASLFFENPSTLPGGPHLVQNLSRPFGSFLAGWSIATVKLAARIMIILVGLSTLLEVCKAMGWVDTLIRFLSPLLRVLGLSRKAGVLWIMGGGFGLIYGAAMIVEEVNGGHVSPEDVKKLQLSIGIQHSVIEDPLILASLGLSIFWAVVPRFLAAAAVVWIYSLWKKAFGGGSPVPAGG
jgi:spore maturation protein SpmB